MTSAKTAEALNPPRRPAAQDQTRREILDHAPRLFREPGYLSTSLRDIAAATGTNAGSLYYHFESKEALAEEVLSQGIAAVKDRVRAAMAVQLPGGDPLKSSRRR